MLYLTEKFIQKIKGFYEFLGEMPPLDLGVAYPKTCNVRKAHKERLVSMMKIARASSQ